MRLPLLALAAMAGPAFAAERSFNVGPFEDILLLGSMDATVATGPAVAVVAEGSDCALDRLDIRTEGNRLVIGFRRDMRGGWTDPAPAVRVTVPRLTAASIQGSGDMAIDRVVVPAFTGRISGSGDMRIATIRAGEVELSISGSGDMRAAGTCTRLAARSSGSGNMRLDDLLCETVDARTSGSGDLVVKATRSGTLAADGSGDIRVTGGATCTIRKSGSGSIVCD